MAKYWVSLTKYAGVEVEAKNEEEAKAVALLLDERFYEFPSTEEDAWQAENAERIE